MIFFASSSFVPGASAPLSLTPVADARSFLPGLGLALAIGMLIGIERGWRMRGEEAGSRVAGVRTFSLLGLLGGLIGFSIKGPLEPLALIIAAAAAAAIILGYHGDMRRDGNVSATSAVAAILTLALGAAASSGHLAVASVAAGAAVILLASRDALHRALVDTSESEIRALVRLVLVVFVILPLLPDLPLGPYGLNPRRLWTVVVVVGAVSFAGYLLVRLLGGRRGVMLTALVGALVSSTAVTLESARRLRGDEATRSNQAAIVLASAIMMVRACFLVAVLTPDILGRFLALLVPAIVASALASGVMIYRSGPDDTAPAAGTIKPPGLKLALLFGGLVALMAIAASWAEQQMRGSGVAVVALGGLFDVDSAIAALGTLPPGTLTPQLAAFAVATPVIFNTTLKAGLTIAIAGSRRGWIPAVALGVPAAMIAASILLFVV